MSKLSYASAERFILSREFFGMKLGLENISRFLARIGSPQLRYRTVHLAGTNGKGSTAAMMASILTAAGYKTGLFTSPHLVTLRERIRVDGRMIPRQSVAAFIARYKEELLDCQLSFFEVIAAMAFYYFERRGVDVAVIETGLGGRLDATNVLTPDLTVTTDVSLDHVEILGPTLRKIAREKAGIIQPRTTHLVGALPPEADEVIRRQCRRRGARYVRLSPKEYRAHAARMNFDYAVNGHWWRRLTPSLIGAHQLKNAALAVKALMLLKESGLRVTRRAIIRGLEGTKWTGRFEVIKRRNRPTVVLDVGHNAAGVEALVQSFELRFPGRKAHVITGFVKRKPHQQMFDSLSRIAHEYILVPLKTSRSVESDELIRTMDWRGTRYRKSRSLATAYRSLSRTLRPDDIIVIAGSHFLVGEFIAKDLVRVR